MQSHLKTIQPEWYQVAYEWLRKVSGNWEVMHLYMRPLKSCASCDIYLLAHAKLVLKNALKQLLAALN